MNTLQRFFMVIAMVFISSVAQSQNWTTIATDASGDGVDGALLDGTKLEFSYDQPKDSLWFRVTVASMTTPQTAALGVNIMVNIPGAGSTFNFWGTNNMNPFHKLITVWVTGAPPSAYTGTIGIANSTGVNASNYTNLSSNNISIKVDAASSTIILGLKRTDFITDSEFSGGTITCSVAAAVGSNTNWNDDIYSPSGTMMLSKSNGVSALSFSEFSLNLYPNPSSNTLYISSPNIITYHVEIINPMGQEISCVNLEPGATINIDQLEKGLYMVRIKSDGVTVVRSFIKN